MSTLHLHPSDTVSETAHSLPDAPSSSSSSSSSSSPSSRSLIWSSIRGMLSLTWPVSLSYLLQFTLGLVNLSFVGHLSADYLAGAALGNMFVNVGGYSIIYGLAGGSIDTLCSQAYGAGNYKHVGLIAQRAATWLVMCCIPILILWSQCEQLLILARQDATVAAIAGSYVRRLMPGLIPNVLFEVIKRYLQTQQIMKPMMIIGICTNLIHAFLCWLLVFRLDLGFVGAPIAMCTAQYVMLFTGIIIVRCAGLHLQTWPTFSFRELFRGWGQLIRLGIPGMFMLCLEWWSFELCAFFAGWIGTTELDAFVVALNILAFCYMLPLGISVSAATLIGNHLGANKAEDAKYACYGAICLTICTQMCIALTLFLLRSSLGKAYSNDEKVISLLAKVIPLVCAMVSFDGYSAVTGGILRGTGKQSVGATVNLGSYYLFGLPLVLLLIHQAHLGIFGIWIGLGSAVTLTSLIQSAYIARIDWQRECALAIDRARDPHSQAGSYAKISTTAEIPMMELELDEEEEENQGTRMSPSHRRETLPNDDEMDALSLITVKATEDEPEHESTRRKKATPRIINVEEKENEDGKKYKKEIRNGTTLHSPVPPIGPLNIPQPPISPQTTDGLSVRKATSFRAEWDLDSEDEARMEGDDDVDVDVDVDVDLDDEELLSDEQV